MSESVGDSDREPLLAELRRHGIDPLEGQIVDRIPIDDLEPRRLYRIRCRNLSVGVWNPETRGFIGVREKFGSEYPFTELHWDADPSFGTVNSMEPMDENMPDDLELIEGWSKCKLCGNRDRWVHYPEKNEHGRSGHWTHDNPVLDDDHAPESVYCTNVPLLEWLKPFSDAEWAAR